MAAEAGGDDAAEAPTLDAADSAPEDPFDAILRRVVRGGSGEIDLVVGSQLAERFQITSVLGAGGMGTVYIARDTTLGRDVAIKVHHAAGGGARLRREAVAMAKLAHPNVVTVFEVGELDGRPFVVMEYVPGTTLRAWLAASARTVDEILAMLIAAGEGLAAAHAVGLVHRDIKPENVLIGADGRARVGDFGLARELDSKEDPVAAAAPARPALLPMTQTGAVLGTPAYMAPEQFAGAPVDARADQFAFCVTAWEALWGERPYPGATFELLHAAIASGARRDPPATPAVPARVRTALDRGLSADPEQRFPSMRALLDALREPVRLRRRRWLVAAGVLAAGAVAALVIAQRGDASCEEAGSVELARLPFDLPMRIAARGGLDAAQRMQLALDAFGADFRHRAHAACAARKHAEWAPELVAKSELCLAIVARTAARELALDPAQAGELVDRVTSLPDPADCTNPLALAARRAPSDDPTRLEALIAAGAELQVMLAEYSVRTTAELSAAVDRLLASPVHDDPEIAAGITLLNALVTARSGHIADSEKLLADAYYAARAIDDDAIVANALIRLIADPTDVREGHDTSEAWTRTALADGERMTARSPALAAQIYGRLGSVADARGDAPAALGYVQRALPLVPPHDPYAFHLLAIAGAVDMWSGKADEGIKLYEQAIAEESKRLGPKHPRVGILLSDYASSLLDINRNVDALRIAERAQQILETTTGGGEELDAARINLAATLLGNYDDDALALLDKAKADYTALFGPRSAPIANINSNLSIIYNDRKDHARALALLEEALSIDEQLLGKDDIQLVGPLYNLAVTHRALHAYPAALAAIQRCIAIYEAKAPGSERHRAALGFHAAIANDAGDPATALRVSSQVLDDPKPAADPQTIAMAQIEKARALLALHRATEAKPLLDRARATYKSLNMQQRLDQIDALAAQLPR